MNAVSGVLPYLVNGVALGMSIGLIALALGLIWRVVGMIDFGLGAVYLVSAYSIIVLHNRLGVPLPLAFIGAFVCGTATSIGLYLCVYRYFIRRNAPLFILVVVALSAFIATENILGAVFSAQKYYFIQTILPGWEVLGTRLNVVQLATMGATVISLLAVAFFCLRTRPGASVMAVADNPQLAQGVGIRLDQAYFWTFGIAGLVVSAAAVPVVAETGVDPYIALNPIFLALAAIIVGGLGAFRNPVFGAILLGLAFHLAVWAISSTWQEVVAYGLVILILLVRPQGLFGGIQAFTGRA